MSLLLFPRLLAGFTRRGPCYQYEEASQITSWYKTA